jgi:hypothetical protein
MFFTRTHTYNFPIPKEELKQRLIGKHVRIHDLDFEVMENEGSLAIIPHAEKVNSLKTLPITTVDMKSEGTHTKVTVTSRMRKIDSGGPQLLVIFCGFLFIASFILLYVGGEKPITYTMLTLGAIIFSVFSLRMQTGYFDYIRKIRAYVKGRALGAQDPAPLSPSVA